MQLDTLTIGQQQLVDQRARAALRGTQFLIFDEPTAYLTRQEAAQLFALIRRLKARASPSSIPRHRLEEIFELADRVSVLRDGTLVGTRDIAETNDGELVALMINRTIEQIYHKEAHPLRRGAARDAQPLRQGLFSMSRSPSAAARSSASTA